MDKLIVDIGKIRGLGNIVSQKSFSDFIGYQSIISESEDTVESIMYQVFSINCLKTSTNLSISVPLNLYYGDSFNISGTLLDADDAPLTNIPVNLKVGETIVSTEMTDGDGVVSFNQTPVYVGTHSFQLSFDGDDKYYSSSSSIVTREINKETTVLNVNSILNNQVFYSSDPILLNGVLTTDDGDLLTDKNIIFMNGEVVETLVTDNEGSFSKTLTGLNSGQYSLVISFEEDDYYTGSSVSLNFAVLEESFTLMKTAGKQILSYYDIGNGEEYCTLTATLMNSNNVDKPVVFRHGSEVLATVNTDTEGKATYTYTSTGAGDVTITAECMTLQETYSIEDCNYYSETGTTLVQNDSTDRGYPCDIPYHHEGTAKYIVEFDFTMLSGFRFYYVSTEVTQKGDNQYYGYGFSRDISGRFVISTRTTTTSNNTYTTGLSNGEERRIKLIIDGTTVSFYDNGNLIQTQTNTWLTTHPPAYFSWATWGTGTVTVKNIKIKPV